jgi:pheromone shutdown-related protein TraB
MLTIDKTSANKQTITFSDGRRLTLIGTAHVSQESIDEVERTIDEIAPDRICVELDNGRYQNRRNDKGWEELDLKTLLKENKGFLMLANMALSSYQKRLGEQMGVQPGDEIMGAARLAEQKGIPLSLCDREIQTTFKRAWRLSSLYNKMKLITVLVSSIFSNEKISNEDIEKLKETDILQSMLEEMAKELPTIKRVLIDERDQFLATSIHQAEGSNIVAVVGAGHVPGLVEHLRKLDAQEVQPDTSSLSYLPKASPAGKVFSWLIVVALLAIIALGFMRTGWEGGLTMFLYWFGLNATLTGVAALLSMAHPATIVLSMLAAPVTALNPTIGVGMVAGIVEASVRKPRVKDFEGITNDIATFKGWFKNRIIHTLLIFMTTSIFASIGTFIAFPLLISKLNLS